MTPPTAPRRMKANPKRRTDNHSKEHDWNPFCPYIPACEPVEADVPQPEKVCINCGVRENATTLFAQCYGPVQPIKDKHDFQIPAPQAEVAPLTRTGTDRCPACDSSVRKIRADIRVHAEGLPEHWMQCFHPWHDVTRTGSEAPTRQDWTIDPASGRSNSSAEFKRLVSEIERLIRGEAHTLINGGAAGTAQLIMAQLAHVHKLAPSAPEKPQPNADPTYKHIRYGFCTIHGMGVCPAIVLNEPLLPAPAPAETERPHTECGQSSRDAELLRVVEDSAIVYYGPHDCPNGCGAKVCRVAKEQGGMMFVYPEGIIYPNTNWVQHVCAAVPHSTPSAPEEGK